MFSVGIKRKHWPEIGLKYLWTFFRQLNYQLAFFKKVKKMRGKKTLPTLKIIFPGLPDNVKLKNLFHLFCSS